VLTAGKVAVTVEAGDPEVPPVAIIDAPHWFGELGVPTGGTRSVTITVSADSETWVLSRRSFDACVASHPVIYRDLIPRQIRDTDRELVESPALRSSERGSLSGGSRWSSPSAKSSWLLPSPAIRPSPWITPDYFRRAKPETGT
jgi:CRP-like cAMP-binding protein